MSEAIQNMLTRRSCRAFKSDAVPEELLDRIVEAGAYAASGMGKQAPIMVVVTNKELRDRLSRMNAAIMGRDGDPFYGAPVAIVVLADKGVATHVYDGSLTMGNLMLAAHDLGLASCWIHRAREEFASDEGKAILAELGVEGDYEGIGHCVIGYAADPLPQAAPRKPGRVVWAR